MSENGGMKGSPAAGDAMRTIRQILLLTVVTSMIGVEAELFLLGHLKPLLQVIPVFLIALGIGSLVHYSVSRKGNSLRLFQWTMTLCIASGVLGIFVHLAFSASEAAKKDKNLYGLNLFRTALTGVAPPFAPGAMIQIGLVGLAYTYRHPALDR